MNEIGVVKNSILKPEDPFKMKKETSRIIIHKRYEEGLYKIDNSEYLQILFYFHEAERKKELKGPVYTGEVKGVFASRSQHRPSPIGLTTVKLLKRDGRILKVEGLDAISGTPVIDIKPFALPMDTHEIERIKEEVYMRDPRIKIMRLIRCWDLKTLLQEAAILHGHYCPGLAFGVMAGAYVIKETGWKNDGMENMFIITETNNCSSDGIQFVTGCTFGNNSLIFRDIGKIAFTVIYRNGEGIRLFLKKDLREIFNEDEEYFELFEKIIKRREGNDEDMERFKNLARKMSFKIISMEVHDLFKFNHIKMEIPDQARIYDDFICPKCQERVIKTRSIKKNGNLYCISCDNAEFYELNGFGIQKRNKSYE